MAEIFVMKKGDTGIPITAKLQDKNGAVNLTGWTVTFVMTLRGSTAPKVEASVTINSNQTTHRGEVTYTWQPQDVDTAGIYNCEFVGITPGGKQITFPRQLSPEQFGIVVIEEGL